MCIRDSDDGADGNIVVQRGDEVSDVFGHVHFVAPLPLQQLRGAIGQVRAEHAGHCAGLIGFVEGLQPIGEDGVGGVGENAFGALLFQGHGDVQHALAGGDDRCV